jgi:dTDP-glucose 4,6-dehydratase
MDSDAFDGARVVLTGAAGFLGSWLSERLVGAGATVVGIDSLATGRLENVASLLDHDRFQLVEADVSDGIDVPPGPVDLVLHMASPASPIHYHRLALATLRVGSEGTRHALELAAAHGARFVVASSSEVYGDPEVHPQPEDYRGRVDPVGPRSVYDEAKRYAEALTAAHREHEGTDTAIARIFNSYGPRMSPDDGRLVPTLVGQALDGEPLTIFGDGSQTRSLCWAGDTVEGLLRLAASGEPGPLNIGSEEEHSVLELAGMIRDLSGTDAPFEHVELPKDDPLLRRPDLTRTRAALGWEPSTPLMEGLQRTIDWFADQRASVRR